mmetsp:Transcript_1573/g.1736  ORF Transcript_1573/g.1736 Transcript_1573/m.1736 type:complete len:308 (-) Transcript_1573:164-1087(-)
MYSTRDERWNFKELMGNVRQYQGEAYRINNTVDSSLHFNNNNNKNENENEDEEEDDEYSRQEEYWKISKDEYDSKANNEIIISFDVLHGKETAIALFRQSQSSSIVKCCVSLYKKKVQRHFAALGRHHHQWQHRWFVLTPQDIIYSRDRDISSSSNKKHYNKNNEVVTTIALTDIERVCKDTNNILGKKNVFQIHTTTMNTTRFGGEEMGTSRPYYLSANSVEERDEWIRTIRECIKLLAPSSSSGRKANRVVYEGDHANNADGDAHSHSTCRSGSSDDGRVTEEVDYSIECIHHHNEKTEVVQTIV